MIGIYGGSFDPVHNAHLAVADAALSSGLVDKVWLMVSPLNPLKAESSISPDACRLAMARLAVESHSGVDVSDFEFSMPRPSYSIATLRALTEKFPGERFTLIIGGDNLADFRLWRDHEIILRDYGVIVYPRPGYEAPCEQPGVTVLADVPPSGISSTLIRRRVAEGKSVEGMVPAAVEEYIRAHGLYSKIND